MARANSLNLNLANCVNYPASSIGFNLTAPFVGGSTPSNTTSFLRAPGSTGSCVWTGPTFSPSFATISYPLAINSLAYSAAGSTISYFNSGTQGGIVVLNSTPTVTGAGSQDVTLIGGSSSIGGSEPSVTAAATTSGFQSFTKTNLTTGYRLDPLLYTTSTSTGTIVVNQNYRTTGGTSGSPDTYTLPTTSEVGDCIRICSPTTSSISGFYKISQAAGQYILVGNLGQTTTGTSGYIQSLGRGIGFELVCIEANLGWAVCGAISGAGLTIV